MSLQHNKRRKSHHLPPTAQEVDAANATARISLGNIYLQHPWMSADATATNSRVSHTPLHFHTATPLTSPPTSLPSLTRPSLASEQSPELPTPNPVTPTLAPKPQQILLNNATATVALPVSQSQDRDETEYVYGLRNQANPVASTTSNQSLPRVQNLAQHPQFLPSPTPSEDKANRLSRPSATVNNASPNLGMNSASPQNMTAPQHMGHAHPHNQIPHNPWHVFDERFCRRKLDAFKKLRILYTADDIGTLSRQTDTTRLQYLNDAISLSDTYYIVLNLILTLRKEGECDFLDPAEYLIIEKIVPDKGLSLQTHNFFRDFPLPHNELERLLGTVGFQNMQASVRASVSSMIKKITQNWRPMIDYCNKNATLPLTRDLLCHLGIESKVLQRAAFKKVTHEVLGPIPGKAYDRAYEYFIAEQYQSSIGKVPPNLEHHWQFCRKLFVDHMGSRVGPTLHSRGQDLQRPRPTTNPRLDARNQPPQRAPVPPSTLLIPSLANRPPQHARPDPDRMALHQAHLRDPTLVVENASAEPVHFRYVSDFALSPQRLGTEPIQELRFHISAEQLANIPRFENRCDGSPSVGAVNLSSLMFRLKCCLQTPENSLSTWATQDTDWPFWIYFTLNGTPLELRRKQQHGKCLPVDITHLVQGENILRILINLSPNDLEQIKHAVAIETVSFASKETLKRECLSRRVLSAEDVRASIRSSMAKPSGSEDDEDAVVITEANVTIPMFEPFSKAKIFDIPVRGAACTHRHAFDLDVFLETRKYGGSGDELEAFTQVDNWKCPICSADARPHLIVVDGFLQEVRRELEAKGLLETRNIVVDGSGNWEIKPEFTNPDDSDGSDGDGGGSHGGSRNGSGDSRRHQHPKAREVVVVDLDSD